ncbi:hypothetical protein [Chromatium okenii]|uniref:hypothetical protein n=1 Tax=Chromatium okenii TaxID=61644 RepID=UPI001559779F|nr:hypothetical protein [Chromatium okenii]
MVLKTTHINGTEDNDTIDGLGGYDVVTYAGSIDGYEITDEGDGQIIVDGNEALIPSLT